MTMCASVSPVSCRQLLSVRSDDKSRRRASVLTASEGKINEHKERRKSKEGEYENQKGKQREKEMEQIGKQKNKKKGE